MDTDSARLEPEGDLPESEAVALVIFNWIRSLERENERLRRRLAQAGYRPPPALSPDYDA